MTSTVRLTMMLTGIVVGVLAGPASAGHGTGQHPPVVVTNPAIPPFQPGAGVRIDIPVDIGAIIDAWAAGEMLVNQTRSSVRYNQRPARLLFYCEASLVLEVTPGEVAPGGASPPAYDGGNTRACAPGEALYVSGAQGLYCQATNSPIAVPPRDPQLSSYSQVILAGAPPLALLGVCVGTRGEVLPALSEGVVSVPAVGGCQAPGSGVRFRGQGRAGYADCVR